MKRVLLCALLLLGCEENNYNGPTESDTLEAFAAFEYNYLSQNSITCTGQGCGIQFLDRSTNARRWQWNFGDGGSSNHRGTHSTSIGTTSAEDRLPAQLHRQPAGVSASRSTVRRRAVLAGPERGAGAAAIMSACCEECGGDEGSHVMCVTGLKAAIADVWAEWDDGWNDVGGAFKALLKKLEIDYAEDEIEKQVGYLLSKSTPLTAEQKDKLLSELHSGKVKVKKR